MNPPTEPDFTAPMVEIKNLKLTLNNDAGAVNVLRGLDLEVGRGETLAIVGPSGSGKSSTLAVIAGLERPTGGTVRVDGIDLDGLDEDALARFRRGRIGIVFQAFHLIPTMSALENVAVPLALERRGDAEERAHEALASVGLAEREAHYPSQLSGGEQQRVAIARASVVRPRLLLADEPTGNLDSESGTLAIDLMFRLCRDTGASLVLITHDHVLAQRCGRVATLREGRIKDSSEMVRP